jgi:peptide deformylase
MCAEKTTTDKKMVSPVPIVQKDEPVLREVAKPVPVEEIKSAKITKIISDMKKALASQLDGVAIAAPQIGVNLRIFVVSKRIYQILGEKNETGTPRKDTVYINPKFTKLSKTRKMMEEGCLSVRYLYGKVYRSDKATIEAYDENGDKINRGASGLLAQIFQHETDHLNGVLFIDKAEQLEEMSEEEYNKIYNQN